MNHNGIQYFGKLYYNGLYRVVSAKDGLKTQVEVLPRDELQSCHEELFKKKNI